MFDEPCAVFDTTDATDIVSIACLRVLRSGIQDSELSDAYVREGLIDRLPGARLSKGEVPKFLVALGRTRGRIITFMRTRISRVGDNHVIALGFTNRKDVPKTGGLAGYSWKTQTEEPDDTHVLYAYDIDSRLLPL